MANIPLRAGPGHPALKPGTILSGANRVGLSTLPFRLNVAHLSYALGDHHFVWRSSLAPYPLIQWNREPGFEFWVEHHGGGRWTKAGRAAVRPLTGERFIRVGQVIP